MSWHHWQGNGNNVAWAKPGEVSATLKQQLASHYRGEVLRTERVLLDLHSGRFFGRAGPLVMDASALLLILLAITGGWMWLKRRR